MAMRAHAKEHLPVLALPCVVILENYTGVALARILEDGCFEALTAAGPVIITAEALANRFSGHIIARAKGHIDEKAAALTIMQASSAPFGAKMSDLAWHIVLAVLRAPVFGLLLILAMIGNLFVFALPVYSMAVYDRIIPHHATETLLAITLGIIIILAIDLFSRLMRARLQEAVGIRISLDLQWMLFQRVLKADCMHAPRNAALLQSAFGAIESACLLAPALLIGLAIDLPFLIITLAYVAYLAKWVVVAPLLTIIAIFIVNIIAHVRARKAHLASTRALIERQTMLDEAVEGLAMMKTQGAAPQASVKYGKIIDDLGFSGYEGRHSAAVAGHIANTIMQLCTIMSLVLGAMLINNGMMSVGALVAATLLTGRAIAPVTMLAALATRAASLSASLHHAVRLAQLPQEEQGDTSGKPLDIKGDIRISHVTLRYPGEPRPALQDISLRIEAGERVGLIGRIGCGKSSLIQMLMRLIAPETGTVMLDEHDMRQYDPAWLRQNIAYMPQDCELMEGTIRDNILLGMARVDDLAFREAARISGVREIVATHPKGYALEVGRRTRQLSGGERQAVCLARALVRRAPVLILDEPTTAMDNQLENAVVDRLRDHVDGRTTIIATHRAPLLVLVNRVIWLDGGRILADGPRDEVIARVARQAA